jgi:hypothetical protein
MRYPGWLELIAATCGAGVNVLADAEPTPSVTALAAPSARALPRRAVRPKCMEPSSIERVWTSEGTLRHKYRCVR